MPEYSNQTEFNLLYDIINHPSDIDISLIKEISIDWFEHKQYRIIFKSILNYLSTNKTFSKARYKLYWDNNYKDNPEIKKLFSGNYSYSYLESNFQERFNELKSKYTHKMILAEIKNLEMDLNKMKPGSFDFERSLEKLHNIQKIATESSESSALTLEEISEKMKEKYKFIMNNKQRLNEFKTTIPEIDSICNFQRKQFAVVWSSTGMGKTTVLLNLINEWTNNNPMLKVLYIALEQEDIEVYQMLTSLRYNIPRNMWSSPEIMESTIAGAMENKFKEVNAKKNIKVIDNPYIKPTQMLIEARKMGADVVIIDNMNNIMVNQYRIEQEYTKLAIDLNAYAKANDCLVIMIQQANANESRPKSTNGLKYAKSPAEKASIVLGVYSPANDLKYGQNPKDFLDNRLQENNINIDEVLYLYNCKGRYTGSNGKIVGYNAPSGKLYSIIDHQN